MVVSKIVLFQLEVILTRVDQKENNSNADVDGNEVHEADDELIAPHLQVGHPLMQYDGVYEQHHAEHAAHEHHL